MSWMMELHQPYYNVVLPAAFEVQTRVTIIRTACAGAALGTEGLCTALLCMACMFQHMLKEHREHATCECTALQHGMLASPQG